MKITAVIQARMGSTRLPGKVLMDLGGKTVLARVVDRLRRATLVNEILVATTDSIADDAIIQECRRIEVSSFRGSENDVLDRYYQAALLTTGEGIVRITSDCPLIDPQIADDTIRSFLDLRPDYASNSLDRTYPRGLDTEVMTRDALACAWREAHLSLSARSRHSLPLRESGPVRHSCGQRPLRLQRSAVDSGYTARSCFHPRSLRTTRQR